MWNWILTNIKWVFSGVGDLVVEILGRRTVNYFNKKKHLDQQSVSNISKSDVLTNKLSTKKSYFELLPLSFKIALKQEIPKIEIWLYAVNYHNKQLTFDSIKVTHLNFSGGPILENINIVEEVKVPPNNSKKIFLHRPLADSEIRAIDKAQIRNQLSADFTVIAKAVAGRKQFNLDFTSISINGMISGI